MQQGRQLQVPAPCKAVAGTDVLQLASAAGISLWTRGTWRQVKSQRYQELQSPREGVTACHNLVLIWAPGRATTLLLITCITASRGCVSGEHVSPPLCYTSFNPTAPLQHAALGLVWPHPSFCVWQLPGAGGKREGCSVTALVEGIPRFGSPEGLPLFTPTVQEHVTACSLVSWPGMCYSPSNSHLQLGEPSRKALQPLWLPLLGRSHIQEK